MRNGISITLKLGDRRRLKALTRVRNAPQKHVWRAEIVLFSADGIGTNEIMRQTGKSKTCVWRWQERFMQEGYDGAIDRKWPIIGIPVFPRRLFSSGLISVRDDSPLSKPSELKGKRVAIRSFQTTLSLFAKGDLKFEYDTPWEEIHWLIEDEEKIGFERPLELKIEVLAKGADVGLVLRDGGCDAVIQPHPPASIMSGEVSVKRLFADPDAEELRYFKKYGWWPIMHIVAVRSEVAQRQTSLCRGLLDSFRRAREISWDYFSDPNWSSLVWERRYYERERSAFGKDPWVFGVAGNRNNLEQLIMYSHDHGLISRKLEVEELFHPSVLNT